MKTTTRFKCKSCGEWHDGIPSWGYPFPMTYFDVPEEERSERCFLTDDLCVVDDERFFLCGCLDLPIAEFSEKLVIRVWAEVEEETFFEYQDLLDVKERDSYGPYLGKLSAALPTYQNTEGIKVELRINNDGIRPSIIALESNHPLTIDQINGLPAERYHEIHVYVEAKIGAG